jgi:hypothetical protein
LEIQNMPYWVKSRITAKQQANSEQADTKGLL